jgi:hypothetical protein
MSSPPVLSAPPVAAEPEVKPARLNFFQRLIGTLFSPAETFHDINRKPQWLLPLVAAIIFASISTGVFLQRIHWDWDKLAGQLIEMQKEQVEKSGRQMPDLTKEQREQQRKIITTVMRYQFLLFPILMPAIMIVLLALLFWGGTALMGGTTTFSRIFSATAFIVAAVVFGVQSILNTIVIMVRNPDDINVFKGITVTNPAMLLSDDAAPALVALLTRFDIFTIWFLILMTMALKYISKNMSTSKSAGVVFGFWTIYVLMAVAFRAVFG